MTEKKKKFLEPVMKVVMLDHADIIATSDISAQSDDDPEDIGYGGSF